MTVFCVRYSPGEPDGTYTLCICATRERAEEEETTYFLEKGFNPDHLYIEEIEVLS